MSQVWAETGGRGFPAPPEQAMTAEQLSGDVGPIMKTGMSWARKAPLGWMMPAAASRVRLRTRGPADRVIERDQAAQGGAQDVAACKAQGAQQVIEPLRVGVRLKGWPFRRAESRLANDVGGNDREMR